MLFFHITSKENAESIKRNGFSFEQCVNKNTNIKINHKIVILYRNILLEQKENNQIEIFNNNNNNNIEVIKIKLTNIKDIEYIKLNKDYSLYDNNDILELNSIITYLKLKSKKKCLINNNGNLYIFF